MIIYRWVLAVLFVGHAGCATGDVASLDTEQRLAAKNCGTKLAPFGPLTPPERRNLIEFMQLVEAEGEKWNGGGKKSGANIEAFRRSSIAIAQAWRGEPITLWGMDQPLRKSTKKVVEISKDQLSLFELPLTVS